VSVIEKILAFLIAQCNVGRTQQLGLQKPRARGHDRQDHVGDWNQTVRRVPTAAREIE
jgi:hypothetical protein